MTREEAKELLPIIQAFAEGRTIQIFGRDGWTDLYKDFIFDISYRYRIKPEPKYRPFKDADECWQEMLKHQPFGWIKSKTGGHYSMVTVVGADEKMKSIAISGRHICPFDETLSNYTFADGTPFGIKEEH